jgi:hypothetical protein
MKSLCRSTVLSALLSLSSLALLHAAEPSPTAAGYWEGEISLPERALPIAVELTNGTAAGWKGTIDIPMQGMRGFELSQVKIEGTAVEFSLPGIPGAPRFSGKLAGDAASIAGEFTQGGGTIPFHLERKTKPPASAQDRVPAKGIAGKGLAGNWRGAINPMPHIELRLELELTTGADGKTTGDLISLDQGAARIPISKITDDAGKVHLETPSVRGEFTGTMSADGSEIAGEWTQAGRATPLVLKRLPGKSTP